MLSYLTVQKAGFTRYQSAEGSRTWKLSDWDSFR